VEIAHPTLFAVASVAICISRTHFGHLQSSHQYLPHAQAFTRYRPLFGVGSFCRGEQLLLGERKLVRVSSGVVIAVDTVFNVLRITAGYHQNAFGQANLSFYASGRCKAARLHLFSFTSYF
jgi:hypothetical protein